MESYELSFKRSVARDLRKIPNQDVSRILARIEGLRNDPRGPGCIKLSGADCYRVRVGQYRILYEIHDHQLLIVVIKVALRSKAY